MVPHRGTNWAAPWLTSQIGRDAVLSRSYGRGYLLRSPVTYEPLHLRSPPTSIFQSIRDLALKCVFTIGRDKMHSIYPPEGSQKSVWKASALISR